MAASNAYGKPMKARPGVTGAIKDAVEAVVKSTTPNVMKGEPRKRAYDEAVNSAVRGRQTTDSNN